MAEDPISSACREMEVSTEGCALLHPGMAPQAAVRALLAGGLTQDALKLLARLLPRRYAVAWLCQCAREQPLPPEDKAGAALAERWLRDPSESNRRAAYAFASAGGYASPGAWLAAAVGWSGGSLAPADQAVPATPGPDLTARAAVAAVNLLAAVDPQRFDARRRGFAAHALELLVGSHGA
ncbi:hypothetical protein [Pseudoxanthomonas sp.]|uniref:DUF6931 family protein n=1 Tax=Pseudoxanthomonas sp. TaxID=1871049 RepID=UPI002623546C|nr:hypothetical protein [Pseudoxanthomonas sp.]WDS37807.1 MAG: hypothetical protein O8I58_08045 [Pseudoxanthomonas sp.]